MKTLTSLERMEIASHVFLGSPLSTIARYYDLTIAEVKEIAGVS